MANRPKHPYVGLVGAIRQELQCPVPIGSHRVVDGQRWRAVSLVRDPLGHWRQIWELATDQERSG